MEYKPKSNTVDTEHQDTSQQLKFIAAVLQGLVELDNGHSITIEELRKSFCWVLATRERFAEVPVMSI
jgi:hypothetical protein